MKRKWINLSVTVVLAMITYLWVSRNLPESIRSHVPSGSVANPALAAEPEWDTGDYAEILQKYVTPGGWVDYASMKKDNVSLNPFLSRLARLGQEEFSQWKKKDRLAFWINAYNSITLQSILDRYPVMSIREIDGVWDKNAWPVMGERMTLNHIENDIIRKKFNEPRIHFSIVCASIGCPPLLNEPFEGSRLEKQFKSQVKNFLSRKGSFRLDVSKKRLWLSPIFDWFGNDFLPVYGTNDAFLQYSSPKVRAVLSFLQNNVSDTNRKILRKKKLKISFTDYDWKLNRKQ